MKKIILTIICFAIILLSFPYTIYASGKDDIWPKAPDIASDAAILMDASTGTILYEKNINERHYPASTTKILTGIIALENSKLNEQVKFSHDAVFNLESGATHIGLDENEVISMRDCLYALLLASANEVANGMAEHISGSVKDFAKLMNEYASNIGCKDSNFVNANGLHDSNHYTTCYDLALIAQYAFTNPTFREITRTKIYTIGKTNLTDETRTFTNHHQMLVGNKEGFTQYKYEDCVGGKTGYTSAADHVLVTYASRDDTTLICVVMNTSVDDQYKDSIKLFDYGFDNFTCCRLAESEETLNSNFINIDLFNRYYSISNSEDSISINSSSRIIIPATLKFDDITKTIDYYSDIKLVEGDNNIGRIVYSYDDFVLGSTDIILKCTSESLTPILSMPDELSSANDATFGHEQKTASQVIKMILKIIGIIILSVLSIIFLFIIFKRLSWSKRQRNRRRISREDYYTRSKKRKKNDFKI